MQGLEKCDERGGLRRSQVLAIRRHVAPSLDYLTDQLVLSQPDGDAVQSWASLPAQLA